MPNWLTHASWASRAGISESTAHIVNQVIDYGSFSTFFNVKEAPDQFQDDQRYFIIKYLYRKDPASNSYVKAYYLHLLLDHLRETRIRDVDAAVNDFIDNKALIELPIGDDIVLNFRRELDDLASMIHENREEIWSDLHGSRPPEG
ncbi:MAG: hypothetical protein JW839_22840 [Candidatus Lokiarchaeota archaeon]|nr:hypothetical protein [Candidatus Lokiarchaeota archaeon]